MPKNRYIFGSIPWYSVLVVLGITAAIFIASLGEKKKGLPKDTVIDLALWIVPFGILGARLYYVIFAWDTFRGNIVSVLYIWNGGLAIYGGIIAGLLTAIVFARKRKIPPVRLLDIIAPGVALAQAIGRWGNFFNMEAYGATVANPALQFFPLAVQIPENGIIVWHMATFFYESCWDLICFLVLMLAARRLDRDGHVFLWYVLLYGTGRMLIEGLRTDSLMSVGGGVRISQLLSACIALGAAAVICLYRLRKKCVKNAWPELLSVIAGMILTVSLGCGKDAFPGSEWIYSGAAGLSLYTAYNGIRAGRSVFRKGMSMLPLILIVAGSFWIRLILQQGLGYYLGTCLCIGAGLIAAAAVQYLITGEKEKTPCLSVH